MGASSSMVSGRSLSSESTDGNRPSEPTLNISSSDGSDRICRPKRHPVSPLRADRAC